MTKLHRIHTLVISAFLTVFAASCSADQENEETAMKSALGATASEERSVEPALRDQILSRLKVARPDLSFTSVKATDSAALYEVEFNGGNVVYVTESGDFFLVGDLYTFNQGQIVNLTEQRKSGQRAELVAQVEATDMISFGPSADKAKAEIYVFTDVDCGYCRKLHDEMDQLNALGVRVNYLAYPRAGIGSSVAKRMQSAWCGKDPQKALTALKQGNSIPDASCDSNAVAEQFLLGQQVGVNGTPALLTADGTLIPGYRPAADLAAMLGIQ